MARREHQVQKERGVPGRDRVGQCARERVGQCAAQRDRGRHQDESLPEWHARAQTRPQRQGSIRNKRKYVVNLILN